MMIMTPSNKDIHATKESFLVAAASYFGLPDDQVMQGSTVEAGADGSLDVVLRVALTPDDIAGIAGRMKVLAEAQPEPVYAETEVPTREQLREQYNALSKQERSHYGSFHHYVVSTGLLDPYRATDKVDLPAHVYLSPAQATSQQKAMAVGRDEKGNYAIAVEDLSHEQKADHANYVWGPAEQEEMDVHLADGAGESLNPAAAADNMRADYVRRTIGAHARLNGADGKPTSNADDFGGVPG